MGAELEKGRNLLAETSGGQIRKGRNLWQPVKVLLEWHEWIKFK